MTELSFPWPDNSTGDGRTYTDDEWSDFWRDNFVVDRTKEGVIRGVDGELAVSGVTSPVSVAAGRALVDGKWYINDATVQVTIPTPSAGNSRIDLIVLEKDWSAQTVRIARVAGTEAASPSKPSLTQTDGVKWQIELAEVLVNDAGNITVTDSRRFARTPRLERIAAVECFSFRNDESVTVGDGAGYLPIPLDLDGYRLVYAHARVKTAPSGGTVSVQINNTRSAADMLSTALTIDDGETGSDTAATPAVIDTANDDVQAYDLLRIDVDAANGAVGLIVTLGFAPA